MTGLCVLTHGPGANGEPLQREAEHGLLCLWHRQRLSRVILDVRDLWVDLHRLLEPGTAPKDDTPKTRRTKAAEAPAPANLDALVLRDHRTHPAALADDTSTPVTPVRAVLTGWMQVVVEERPITDPPTSLLACLDLLHRHGDWIAGQAWVDDFMGEFDDARRALSAATRDQPWRTIGNCQLPDPEDQRNGVCGGKLVKENGSDVITCRNCGQSWTTPRQQWLLARSLEAS